MRPSLRLSTIQQRLNIVQCMRDSTSWSVQTSSIYPCGQNINYNKKDIRQTLHNHNNTQFCPNPIHYFGHIYCLYCAIHTSKLKPRISSIYLLGQHINSNLGSVNCSSYITTLLSHSHINNCLICAHLKLVIVWYECGIRSCSTQTSSICPYGWYINSNLGHVVYSKYTTTRVIHEQVQFPRQIRIFTYIVWYICARERFSD